jgi:hypothetical protein
VEDMKKCSDEISKGKMTVGQYGECMRTGAQQFIQGLQQAAMAVVQALPAIVEQAALSVVDPNRNGVAAAFNSAGSAITAAFTGGGGGGGCFPASSTVRIADGSQLGREISITELELGDSVLSIDSTGALTFSKLYVFGHRNPTTPARFFRLETESGATLELTQGHYLHASIGGVRQTLPAELVKVGHKLWVLDAGELVSSPVVSVTEITTAGLFNPYTFTGDIIVNGVLASSHSEHHLFPIEPLLKTFMSQDKINIIAPKMHQVYFAWIREVYNTIGPSGIQNVALKNNWESTGWETATTYDLITAIIHEMNIGTVEADIKRDFLTKMQKLLSV